MEADEGTNEGILEVDLSDEKGDGTGMRTCPMTKDERKHMDRRKDRRKAEDMDDGGVRGEVVR